MEERGVVDREGSQGALDCGGQVCHPSPWRTGGRGVKTCTSCQKKRDTSPSNKISKCHRRPDGDTVPITTLSSTKICHTLSTISVFMVSFQKPIPKPKPKRETPKSPIPNYIIPQYCTHSVRKQHDRRDVAFGTVVQNRPISPSRRYQGIKS